MKTSLATVFSLSGVLVAGSAAAVVNTQVLNGADASGTSISVVADTVAAAPTDPGPTSVVSVSTTVATSATPTTAPTSQTEPESTQAVYAIGAAGTVTLDTAGGALTVAATTPAAGWEVSKAESNDALNVEVTFQSADTVIEFKANLLFGVVGTSVETTSVSSGDPGASNSVAGGDDDHGVDDGGHGGGDHDDDD